MPRSFVLFFVFSLASAALGQSGRIRAPQPSPPPVVSPSPATPHQNSDISSAGPEKSDEQIYKTGQVSEKVRVKEQPKPKYTQDARKHQLEGTVVLRCVFRSTGEVTNITVIKGLPDGLTDRAIAAARQIKFKPAMNDRRPVSMWMQLEYNFTLY
jgi:periplasmic protein TonB